MRVIFFAIFIIASQSINTLAIAQNEALNIDSKLALELAEVKQERVSIESKFKILEAACYKKFAVSDCLQDLKSERLLALGDIRRRELAINGQKRQLKADAVYKKSKKLVEKEEIPVSVPNSPKSTKSEKSNRSESIRAVPAPKDQTKLTDQRHLAAQQRASDLSKKQAASQQKALSRAKKLSQAEEQTAKFNKKLLEAEARKRAVEKRDAEKTKSKSAPLPIPSPLQIKP
jgi:colicin import membrane protein